MIETMLLALGLVGVLAAMLPVAAIRLPWLCLAEPGATGWTGVVSVLLCGGPEPVAVGAMAWVTALLAAFTVLQASKASQTAGAEPVVTLLRFALVAGALGIALRLLAVTGGLTRPGAYSVTSGVIALLLAAIAWSPARLPGTVRDVARGLATRWVLLLAALVTGALAYGGVRATGSGGNGGREAAPAAATLDDFAAWYDKQPRVPTFVQSPTDHIQLVVFNDYQCPPCRYAATVRKRALAKHEAERRIKVDVFLMDFPLEPECNEFVAQALHPAACEAAGAVRLARRVGREQALGDWLYANQQGLTGAAVWEAARRITGVADIEAQYPTVLSEIRDSVRLAHRLGVRGTPTSFLDGIKLDGVPFAFFDLALAREDQRGLTQTLRP